MNKNNHSTGLDTVELAIAIEDTFDITIPDETAVEIRTVGDIVTTVCALLDGLTGDRCKTQHLFYRLRRSLWVGARDGLRPATSLRSVVRDEVAYRELELVSGLKLPALDLPLWYRNLYGTLMMSLLVLTLIAWWVGWQYLLGAILLITLLTKADRHFDLQYRREVPDESVRQFVYRLLTRNYRTVQPGEYNEAEVYRIVKQIIVEKAGVSPEMVHPAATISEDLGMD